jgi:hypothetical protein
MAFMDKAKKLAGQAQTKLDEAQKQFNKQQGSGSSDASPGPVGEYDEHGRPVPQAEAETATPPHGDPVAGPAEPAPPPAPPSAPEPDPAAPQGEDPKSPPRMTGGDPLAG